MKILFPCHEINNKVETPDRFFKKIIEKVVENIDSNFFTIDVIHRKSGECFIVETGDGQVSGLSPNQNYLYFYSKIKAKNIE